MRTSSSDKTTPTRRREPLRWLAAAALLLAFLSICCVAQVVTFLMTPRNYRSSLDLLSKNQADYSVWQFDLPLPGIGPEVPQAIAADLATATPALGAVPTAELAVVPEVAGAPTPTLAGVNPPTPILATPTPTPTSGGAIASGPTQGPVATSAGGAASTSTAISQVPATPTNETGTGQPTRTTAPETPATPTSDPNQQPTNTPRSEGPRETNTSPPATEPPPPATEPPPPATEPPAATSTPRVDPTNTRKPEEPRKTNTPVRSTPTRTSTPVPPAPTRTSTPVPPPTPTNTLVPPPTPTNTLVPPTTTSTPVPPTATNTQVPPTATTTDTPVPPTPTPTVTVTPTPPVIGTVDVFKELDQASGPNGTRVVYTIRIENNTNVIITLSQIVDDMTSIAEFTADGCSYPDGSTCTVPVTQPVRWEWNGSVAINPGGAAEMTIEGTFASAAPPPQQFCNTANVLYVVPAGSTSDTAGPACFTLN